ncbi:MULTISPECIES: T9SS type A sorting domain-containing protein [Emticicia]|uniref:T9SS type A sorting domain-containing protein n=1 Tax=Emticicia TaxID=312278 RepID=UPI0009ED91B6|nr:MULTISPECIES: T9SS type A sorting domain-containing protein [Emticicia]
MRKIYLSVLLLLMVMSVFAQTKAKPRHNDISPSNPDKIEFMKGKMIVCPGIFEDANTFVPMAKEVEEALKGQKARGAAAAKTTFIVTYNGFSPAAQRAFQAAVDIWANLISSPVPIRITATWRAIDSGNTGGTILGQASPADFTRNFPGQQRYNTWYPIALAEKIAGQELNSINDPDITAEFNSSAPWYLGTAAPGANQFDFTSVVLHELCHGLGFTASLRVNSTNGQWGFGTGSPFVYDHFVENGTAQLLINTANFANPSVPLKDQMTSDNLFYNSPTATNSNNGVKAKIYAPNTYQAGSSISHVNDATYPSGNPNSLMTASASLREIIRDPGPIVKGIFADMGWKGTSLLHTRVKNIENTVSKVTIKATITSDTTLVAGSAKVFYTENDTLMTNAKPLNLVRIGNTNDYSVDVPITKTPSIIRYYLVVEDDYKRKNTAPAEAPTKGYYGFSVGNADVTAPFVTTNPPTVVPTNGLVDIFANIEDNFEHGIDTVYVEYKLNGVDQKPFGVKKYNPLTDDKAYSQGRNDAFSYLAKTPFGSLKQNDRVLYRIVAIDKSKNKNKTVLPAYLNTPGTNVVPTPDYYEFIVSDLKTQTPVTVYSNTFDTANDDIAGIGGWGIAQPTGFTNGALHSAHPYKNGGNEDLQSNTIALLRIPIQLKQDVDSATITFDEVALVEPGESGSTFGDSNFYDYVVVEGSYDGGASWIPFEDGYDASRDASWEKAFNSAGVNGTFIGADGKSYQSSDSRGTATSALFKTHTIKMLSSGDFAAGDVVLIRFRLFADELTYGWGWVIDNLKVQVPPPPPVLATEQSAERVLTLTPNPSPDEILISTNLAKPGRVKMEVLSSKGVKVMEREFLPEVNTFNQKIDLRDLTVGTYMVRLYTENGVVVKRFVVNK